MVYEKVGGRGRREAGGGGAGDRESKSRMPHKIREITYLYNIKHF